VHWRQVTVRATYLYFGKGFAWAMELANEVREALDKRDIRA
jgi:hypothetical protein